MKYKSPVYRGFCIIGYYVELIDLFYNFITMEEFTLKGDANYLKIELVEVYGFPESISYNGGYDTKSVVKIY